MSSAQSLFSKRIFYLVYPLKKSQKLSGLQARPLNSGTQLISIPELYEQSVLEKRDKNSICVTDVSSLRICPNPLKKNRSKLSLIHFKLDPDFSPNRRFQSLYQLLSGISSQSLSRMFVYLSCMWWIFHGNSGWS